MEWLRAIFGGVVGGIVSGVFGIITTYMVINNSFEVQSRAIKYEVLKNHKVNYLNLIECKENIKKAGLKFSEAMFVNSKSEESFAAYKTYKKFAQSCVSEIVAYNLQLEAVNVKSKVSSCMVKPLSQLSKKISDIYSSDKQNLEVLDDLEQEILYELPKQWDECLENLNNSLLILSKHID